MLYVFPGFGTERIGEKIRCPAEDDLFRDSLGLFQKLPGKPEHPRVRGAVGDDHPARTFFQTLTASAGRYGGGKLPDLDRSYLHGRDRR